MAMKPRNGKGDELGERARERYAEMQRQSLGASHVEFTASEPPVAPPRREQPHVRQLNGLHVAVIVADGFEQSEFDGPVAALRAAGAKVEILAPRPQMRHIKGVHHFEPAPGTSAGKAIAEADPADYDALVVPGGLASPDAMRQSPAHLAFVKAFAASSKPLAMICHGPWLLADADAAEGRTLTSWPGIKRDLERAGARWLDEEVVIDGNLITSRRPDDVPAFSQALIAQLAAVSNSA